MTMDNHEGESASQTDLAIERALEAARLRAGDSLDTSTASVSGEWEPSAVEAGDIGWDVDGE